jgi:hypothetical protein
MPSFFRKKHRSAITYRYLSYELPNGGIIRLPMVSVRLSHNDESLTTVALVDSGSTTTFVPLEFAEILSLPIEEEGEAIGAGGSFQNTIRKINMSILKGNTVVKHFNNFPVYVPIEEGRVPYVVLGRDSIFRAFDITFRENKQKVILRGAKK